MKRIGILTSGGDAPGMSRWNIQMAGFQNYPMGGTGVTNLR